MAWDQLKENLEAFINTVKGQWAWFVDDQRDVLEGKRDHLYGKAQKAYVTDSEEAEQRLANWQKRQRDKIRG